jgi:GT2 family glycosyltransferase
LNLENALYRSAVLRRIGGFDESLRFGEDLDYFDRLRKGGNAVFTVQHRWSDPPPAHDELQ